MAFSKSVLTFRTPVSANGPQSLVHQFQAVRRQTLGLVSPLSPEDQMVQSCPEASPAKWHLAHTTWFFETFILSQHLPGYQPFRPEFRDLFNSYYNAIGHQPEKALRNTFSRPGLDEVLQYRAHVEEHMEALLASDDQPGGIHDLVVLGLNHEQQHQELLVTDIKHAFWTNPLRPTYMPATAARNRLTALPQTTHKVAEGLYEIGSESGFCFDNEVPRHKAYLQQFRIAGRLATAGEYLEFMKDGGYSRPGLWLSDGWKTVQTHGWRSPLYWEERDGEWWEFTCSGMRKVDHSTPVCHVSLFEADAFARWAGARLPTEFEWEVVAQKAQVDGNLLESDVFHPEAAPKMPGEGPIQLFGDVWEWTSSAYLPYPGYRPAAGALGEYNGKFMSGQMVLRGGSCVTPQSHVRASYRNFFQPETRWQFSGIRLAGDGD